MPKKGDQYPTDEAQRRFEAALRGSREVGPTPMKDVPPKRKGKGKDATRKRQSGKSND